MNVSTTIWFGKSKLFEKKQQSENQVLVLIFILKSNQHSKSTRFVLCDRSQRKFLTKALTDFGLK